MQILEEYEPLPDLNLIYNQILEELEPLSDLNLHMTPNNDLYFEYGIWTSGRGF